MPNIERLEQLKRVVRDAPEHQFHMNTIEEKAGCGTARCAIGWARVDPWFEENTDIYKVFHKRWDNTGYYMDDGIAGDLFGISEGDASRLFATDPEREIEPHEIDRQDVIENIDRLISGKNALIYEACLFRDEDDEDDIDGDDD